MKQFRFEFTGEYVGGLIMGLGLGLFLGPMPLLIFFVLSDDYETPRLPREWFFVSGVIYNILVLIGGYIARRSQRRRLHPDA